jgi:hypothetical protein
MDLGHDSHVLISRSRDRPEVFSVDKVYHTTLARGDSLIPVGAFGFGGELGDQYPEPVEGCRFAQVRRWSRILRQAQDAVLRRKPNALIPVLVVFRDA